MKRRLLITSRCGFDIKYVVLPQKYIAGSTRDGSFMNIYAGVNMEFGVDSDKRKASESSRLAMI